jgi:hypothetical protein
MVKPYAPQPGSKLLIHNPNPMAALEAFARVLDTNIEERHLPGKTFHLVRGRIGECEGTDRLPRAGIPQCAVVRHDEFDELAGVGGA